MLDLTPFLQAPLPMPQPFKIALLVILVVSYPFSLAPHPTRPALSLDYLLYIYSSLIFPTLHIVWFLVVGYLLSVLATNKPFSRASFASVFIACFYTLLYGLQWLNVRLGYGAKRKVEWDDEVVVVTGGAGGLGWLIAQVLEKKGAAVAVWDVKEPKNWNREEAEDGGIQWYKCDIGDAEEVRKTTKLVQENLGTPTILINNAGIVNGQPLLTLATSAIERSIRVNLLSHFHTVQAFLPAMLERPNGGTIVTVSSVLGHLGASHLTDYTASKAGLLAFHNSLNAEIASMASAKDAPVGAKNVRTVLVKPGQLSTAMFGNLKTPSDFLGPVVNAKDLAMEIVKAIEGGRNAVVAMPLYAWCIEWMGVLPASLQRAARWCSGVDRAMETFGGSPKR